MNTRNALEALGAVLLLVGLVGCAGAVATGSGSALVAGGLACLVGRGLVAVAQ